MRSLMEPTQVLALFVSLLMLAMVLGGCPNGENTSNGATPQTGDKGEPGAKAGLKVGVVMPMSGQTATFGEEAVSGLKLALDEINAQSDAKIELVIKDDKGDSTETANLVGQVIKVDNVRVIIGSVTSTSTLKGGKVAQENGIPMLSPSATNVDVTRKGEFVSRICFIDEFQGEILARLALGDLGKRKVVILTDKASDYSIGLAAAFKKTFVEGGGQVLGEESYTSGDADFSALITKVAELQPDVLFIPGYYGDVGPMLKQAGEKWKDIPMVSGDGIDSPDLFKLMGNYPGQVYMSTHFAADDTDPKVQEFVKKYKARFGKPPGAMAALGYDSLYAVYDAFKRAGSDDPVKLRDAINGIKGLSGVTGTITLDKDRNAQKDAVVLKVSNSGGTFYKRVGSTMPPAPPAPGTPDAGAANPADAGAANPAGAAPAAPDAGTTDAK